MSNLKETYRFYRSRGAKPWFIQSGEGNAQACLRMARQDIAAGKGRSHFYPASGKMSGGAPFAAYGEKAMMWFESPESHMRKTGYAHDIIKLRYTGWFTDDDGDNGEVARGVVYQLPTRNGKLQFMYGYEDPNNKGAACLSLDLADNKEDAARWADHIAERYAEECRDYNRAWQAGRQYDELGNEISEARKACLALIKETRAACASLAEFPLIKSTIRGAIHEYRAETESNRRKRAKLFDEFGTQRGFADA